MVCLYVYTTYHRMIDIFSYRALSLFNERCSLLYGPKWSLHKQISENNFLKSKNDWGNIRQNNNEFAL